MFHQINVASKILQKYDTDLNQATAVLGEAHQLIPTFRSPEVYTTLKSQAMDMAVK